VTRACTVAGSIAPALRLRPARAVACAPPEPSPASRQSRRLRPARAVACAPPRLKCARNQSFTPAGRIDVRLFLSRRAVLFAFLPRLLYTLVNILKEDSMAHITLGGSPVETSGTLPAVGTKAPDFKLTKEDLSDVTLADFAGKKKIVNIVPSLDTSVCALSAKRFDRDVASIPGTVILNVSNDLPFAMSRFCKAEGLTNIVPLSQLRDRKFGADWGVAMVSGKLEGLLSRAVVVLDENNKVLYAEQVSDIKNEPDYAKALAALKG
jgi:thioredoxin-dependent peroxiredoxin